MTMTIATSFAAAPTKLIQVDVDAREIGKNYPVSVPLLADAREALKDLLDALGPGADGSATVSIAPKGFKERGSAV